MKLQVKQTGSRQELTIGSQKEFLRLWNTGVIAADDLVQRGEGWVRAGDLPWIHGMLPGEYDPVSLIRRPAAPLMIKLRAKTRWLAMDAGLRALKAQGKISDYTIEPRPQAELEAEAAEKAKLAARKAAGAKAVAEE